MRNLFICHSILISALVAAGLGLQPRALAQSSTCVAPPSGLVGWWKGEGNTLDSVGGTSGVPRNVSYTNGLVGQAFAFDPNSYPYGTYVGIDIPDQPAYALTNSLSIEGWIRPRGDGYVIFWRGDNRPGLDPYSLSMQGNNILRFYVEGESGNSAFIGAPLVYNQWYHVAATLDGNSGIMSLYTNGTLAAQTTTTVRPFGDLISTDSPGIGIGNVNDGFNNFPFTGDIDEIALYNRALSGGEVQAIYNAGSAGKCPLPPPLTNNCVSAPSGLVGWWKAEGNTLDSAGTNNGTLAGNATYAPGEAGQGFVLDGNGDAVQVGNPASLQLQDFTIETWMQRGDPTVVTYSGSDSDFFGYGYGGYGFGINNNGNLYLSRIGIDNVTLSPGITDTNFHHVAVTKSGTTVVFYIDGVAHAVPAYSTTYSFTATAAIGARGDNLTGSFLGRIDELSIYSRALSAGEIQSVFNAGSAGKCTVVPPPPNNCVSAPSGLVGWWKAEGNTLDSVGGTSGVPRNISYTNGVVGQAFAFDPNSYPYGTYVGIDIPDQPAYALTNSLSIEGWIRPRGDGYNIFWRGDNRPGMDPYFLGMWGNNNIKFLICDQAGNTATVGTTLNYNQWYHVAATLDGNTGTMSLYTNGTLAAQTTTTVRPFGDLISTDSPGIGIGNVNDGSNNFPFTGDIDEISLYNRALSSGEVQAIYAAGSAGKCTALAPGFLLDIDIQGVYGSSPTTSAKVGFAAVGQTASDYWNFYTRDDPTAPGGGRASGAVSNLLLVDKTPTQIGMTVDNGPGAWASDSTDPMYAAYIYPFSGNLTITLTNLPVGQYDVLPYSREGIFEATVGAVSYGIQQAEDPATAGAPVWTEGVQYARFNNVQVTGGQPLVLTVRPGLGGYATLSGLQILQVGPATFTPPSIVSQPADQTVAAGDTATFSVLAEGTPSPSYQWLLGGSPIDGQTGSSLVLSGVQPGQAGIYSVIVSNAYGKLISSNAVLTVLTFPPAILSQPKNVAVYEGSNATFSVQASGTAPLSYQWFFNGAPVGGVSTGIGRGPTLSLKAVKPDQAGTYWVTVSNAYGFKVSSNAVLTILPPPVCLSPPSGIVAWWRAESNTVDSVGINDLLPGSLATQLPVLFQFTAGKVGAAFSFSGIYPQTLASDDLDVGSGAGLSIEGWIRPNSHTSTQPLVEWNDGRANVGAGLMLNPGSGPGVIGAFFTDTNTLPARSLVFRSPLGVITNQVWQHVALTFDRATGLATIYVNGVSVAQTNLGTAFSPATRAPVYLGYRPSGSYSSTRFIGAMDEISLYNRALTAAEIQSIYLADYAGKCPPPPPPCVPAPSGIVGWWRGQSNALDSVNGNDGVISNSITYTNGKIGLAFQYGVTASPSYVRIPAANNLDVGAGPGLSVELWVNPAIYGAQSFVEWNSGTGTQGVYLAYSVISPVLEANLVDTQGVSHIIQSPLNLISKTAAWEHLGLTYDRSSGIAALYFNGIRVTQTNIGSFTPRTGADVYLGYRPPGSYLGSERRFRGAMDEVSIYNRALTALEMRSIMIARGLGKCVQPPILLTQPQDQNVNLDQTAVFSVTADGTPILNYQWYFNGDAIDGAIDPVLTLSHVQTNQSGSYFVVVSNRLGVAASSNAVLRVNLPPAADATATVPLVISCNQSNATVVLDGSRSMDLDGDPLQYSWFANGAGSTFATGMVAVVKLPVGTNSITLRVSDGLASNDQTISVQVITAAEAVARLQAQVAATVSKNRPSLATLNAAQKAINQGRCFPAIIQLRVFQFEVQLLVGRQNPSLAATLVKASQSIVDALGGCCPWPGEPHERISPRFNHDHGKMHLEFPASHGKIYIIEASSDLVHWQKIGVAAEGTDGTFKFDDDILTQSPGRFYRIVAP